MERRGVAGQDRALELGLGDHVRYVGSHPQMQLTWVIDRHITFVAIYAHFFAGPFLRETGPADDVDYFATWESYEF